MGSWLDKPTTYPNPSLNPNSNPTTYRQERKWQLDGLQNIDPLVQLVKLVPAMGEQHSNQKRWGNRDSSCNTDTPPLAHVQIQEPRHHKLAGVGSGHGRGLTRRQKPDRPNVFLRKARGQKGRVRLRVRVSVRVRVGILAVGLG